MLPTDTAPIILRVSNVVHFESCKRAWWLGLNYSTGRFTPAFFIGTGIHTGLEAYYRNERSVEHALAAVDAYGVAERSGFDQYVQTWNEIDGDGKIQEIRDYIAHYALYDNENYLAGTILEDDDGPIIEKRLSVPILDQDGQPLLDSNGNVVMLTGQCDLALDRNNGVYIVDHKSFGTRTMADKPEEGLEVDDQGTAYCYLFWRTYGVVPRAFIYNVIIKQHPEPPALLKNGSLSMSKSQYTTAALYRKTIKDKGLSSVPYLDFLAYLEQQGYGRFFQRWQSSRNEQELRSFERRLAYKARDIIRLVEDPDAWAYPSGSSYRCGNCAFIAPCKAADDGGDGQAILDNQFERKTLWEIT